MRRYLWLLEHCEHCDGDRQDHRRRADGAWQSFGRDDYLRGFVCQTCDDALDKMLEADAAEEVQS